MTPEQLTLIRQRIFNRAALVIFGVFILNFFGIYLALYHLLWWYDMPMHFLGGLFTGLLVLYIVLRQKSIVCLPNIKIILISLYFILAIGFAWELYEFFVKTIIVGEQFIFRDSISDLFFDLAGGIEAMFIYLRHRRIVLAS